MQGSVEGGFMGRTNKLVDGCYSYWVGALFPLVASLQQQEAGEHHSHQSAKAAGSLPDSLPASLTDRSQAGESGSAASADHREATEKVRLTGH